MRQIAARLSAVALSRRETICLVLGLAGSPLLVYLIFIGQVRAAVALTVAGVLLSLATVRIQTALLAMMAFLVLMGDLRRLLIPWAGWSGTDPLLVIGPVFAIVICAYTWASGKIRLDTPLSRWVLALMIVMGLQVFNPRQGGLIVGVGGVMFLMVPLFWFWIGRVYATPAFLRVLFHKVVVPLSLLAALMGFYQVLYGYLPYQLEWYRVAGYIGIGSPESGLAPISFFASGTEHGTFLIVGGVLLWAAVLRGHSAAWVPFLALLAAAVLTGSRGPVVKLLTVSAGLWGVMGRSLSTWLVRGSLALLICGAGLVWGLSNAAGVVASPEVQGKLDRQAALVNKNPGQEGSTLRVHALMMVNGYRGGLEDPLGHGIGATTKFASKFGEGKMHGSETDLADSFVTLGIFGGVIYHVVAFFIVLTAFRYWHKARSQLALALLGFLGVTFLIWLGAGYAVAPLLWFCIGALDQLHNDYESGNP